MKKKFILFILLLMITTNVYATETYPKTFKTENYGVVLTDTLKCGDTEVEYLGYSNTGNVFVKDSNEKIYIWDDNKCKNAKAQEILDLYNQTETYAEGDDEGNIVITTVLADTAYTTGYILNTEPFDETLTYYFKHPTSGYYNGNYFRGLNADNIFDDDYYLEHTFFHIKTTEYDSNKTYYIMTDKKYLVFEKVTEPFTEEESINIYYMDDDADLSETTRTIKYEPYEELETEYGEGTVSLIYANDKIISTVEYTDGEETKYKHFDENKNEVYTEYSDYLFYAATKKFVFGIDSNFTKALILDIDFNLIDIPVGWTGGIIDAGDLLVYLELDQHTYETNYYYYKSYYLMDGKDQTYKKGTLTFRFNGNVEAFDKLYIDNVLVDSSNYTKKSGSTIIELKESYIKTLSNGEHSIKAVYDSGAEVSTTFNKQSSIDNPQTYDNINITILLGILSLISIIICRLYLNKKRLYD